MITRWLRKRQKKPHLASRSRISCNIAILDHKSNPAHPSPWRVDGQLGVSPTRAIPGDWTIPKGETAAAKYRFVIYAGPLDAKRVEAAFESWK
jgi:hypothetical protein